MRENMGISLSSFLTISSIICVSISPAASNSGCNEFLKCFHLKTNHSNSNVVFPKKSTSYPSILQSSARNLRFSTNSTPKPELIIKPVYKFHIQAAIVCSRKNGMTIRVRSGGHDYEGLSYVSDAAPFIIVDLSNLRSIKLVIKSKSAWVESGTILGELYHKIAEKSSVYGFPAGSCPTVGVGGHFSGGGFGTIFRKYGLAADNIVDAKIVDVNGRILDRKSMGEDLFWAIRGGGGASFGIIFAWKIKLVPVPSIVTVFNIGKTLDQGATKLFHKWQSAAGTLTKDLFLHAAIGVVDDGSQKSNKTIVVEFRALFLGRLEKLLSLMEESFPELGVERESCKEMSWIESVLYFAGYSIEESDHVLLNRTQNVKSFFKGKSDYVKEPISEKGLEGLWKIVVEEENALLIMTPYGGKMSEISDSEIPFPHRSGNLYKIQYMATWESERETEKHMDWIRKLYGYMTPLVSKNPRSAYVNYRDLDLGVNNYGFSSYAQGSVWGLKYFKDNFKRLAQIKAKIDPSNFFRDEQSIPLF